MNTKMLAIVAIILWVASAAFVGFKFVKGTTVVSSDGREAIVLSAGERDFVLNEMRGMLAAVQEIIAAVNEGDVDALKETALRVGTAEVQAVPVDTMMKLPMAFKKLGRATHVGFDEVAQAAEFGPEAALEKLEENLSRCVACHEVFLLAAEK